jgi:hypothetical protein
MPVAPGKAKMQSAEVELGDNTLRPEIPMVRCRVVYMGNNRSRSVALPGQVHVEKVQTGFDVDEKPTYEETRRPIQDGIQNYDFSSHDTLGRLIPERIMAPDSGPDYAGKPFAFCEHIDHIRWFHLQRTEDGAKEFRVLASRQDQPIIQDHVRRFISSKARTESDFEAIASR